MHFIIHQQSAQFHAAGSHGILELPAEAVIAHLADKGCLFAQLLQHGQHVAWRPARIGLVERVAEFAVAGPDEVDQQFTQRRYIIFLFCHFAPSRNSPFLVATATDTDGSSRGMIMLCRA